MEHCSRDKNFAVTSIIGYNMHLVFNYSVFVFVFNSDMLVLLIKLGWLLISLGDT